MEPTDLVPGTVVAGRYRIEGILGRGGMATVYAAIHVDLEVGVAVKVLHAALCANEAVVKRFAREARNAGKLTSEYVARVTDYGRLESGEAFLVMERLVGEDLHSRLRTRHRLSHDEAAELLLQVMAGLAEAHARGIIHRDLKPANVFVLERPDGSPWAKVLDFGISTACTAGDEHDLTTTRIVLGSPQFMAPEQMANARQADVRSDVWSLGVVAYRMLAGRLPFRGRHLLDLTREVAQGTPTPLAELAPDLPDGLERVVLRALERDPGARYQDVAEFARALLPYAPPGYDALVTSLERVRSTPAAPDFAATGEFGAARATVRPPTVPPEALPAERASGPHRGWALGAALVLVVAGLGMLLTRGAPTAAPGAAPLAENPPRVPAPSAPAPSASAPSPASMVTHLPSSSASQAASAPLARPTICPSPSATPGSTPSAPAGSTQPAGSTSTKGLGLPSDPWGWE